MGGDSFSSETSGVNEKNGKTAAIDAAPGKVQHETNSSTEVFTRRFYILAVFSIFTMEQVWKHVLHCNWLNSSKFSIIYSWVWCCVQNHVRCIVSRTITNPQVSSGILMYHWILLVSQNIICVVVCQLEYLGTSSCLCKAGVWPIQSFLFSILYFIISDVWPIEIFKFSFTYF